MKAYSTMNRQCCQRTYEAVPTISTEEAGGTATDDNAILSRDRGPPGFFTTEVEEFGRGVSVVVGSCNVSTSFDDLPLA